MSDERASQQEKRSVYEAVLNAFREMSPASQAWFLAVIPKSSLEFVDPFVEIVLDSGDPAAILVCLARFADTPSSRTITVATSSGNESLVRAGSAVREYIVELFEQEAKQLELPPE